MLGEEERRESGGRRAGEEGAEKATWRNGSGWVVFVC